MMYYLDDFKELFDLLDTTKGVIQREEFHPEKDLYMHLMQTFQKAIRESDDIDLILAALFHDVGKTINPKGHDREGIIILKGLLSVKSLFLIEQHMRIWYLLLGQMKKLSKVKFLLNHPWLPELIALARWDKMSRNPHNKKVYDKNEIVDILNKKIEKHFKNKI